MLEQNINNNNNSLEKEGITYPPEKDIIKSPNDLYSDYKNYKWKDPDKLRNGPYGDENRKCRDCFCCIIFIIFPRLFNNSISRFCLRQAQTNFILLR